MDHIKKRMCGWTHSKSKQSTSIEKSLEFNFLDLKLISEHFYSKWFYLPARKWHCQGVSCSRVLCQDIIDQCQCPKVITILYHFNLPLWQRPPNALLVSSNKSLPSFICTHLHLETRSFSSIFRTLERELKKSQLKNGELWFWYSPLLLSIAVCCSSHANSRL